MERATEGTSRLHSEYTKETWAVEAFAKAQSKTHDPERCRKISEFHRGKPKPPHVHEAMRKGWQEKGHTEESRRKISEALRRRGALVLCTIPWTAEEDELV